MHRDLKPENIILKDNSNDLHIFLADFGLATYVDKEQYFRRCGTPGYVAPEILGD
jgi:serine/threonine protein kinase